ncbi:hypothetical protein GCM10022243_01980 [Saccharothrix violaceirubra]|uniref:Uncharacterized protein n=1 Tax=Saccharothrix violaceirubra TaxID=413306 RepID=A0A7W7WWC7_9PSEU|nr:hypothetical protein [Saccharothrix violaceirubra]MBB4965956.1 hypothetical protein [Saccharothrix violaceirubra]
MFRPVPVPALPPSTALADLTATGDDHAWLAGTTGVFTSRPSAPLILRWTGTAWRVEDLPGIAAAASLAGISATGPDDVWAVGNSAGRPLVLHWDGTRWHLRTPPAIPWAKAVLALAPDDVHVVGAGPDVLHWDGTDWHRTAVLSSDREGLQTVTATGPDDIWAGGAGLAGVGPATYEYPVLVRRTATGWHEVRGPHVDHGHVTRLAVATPEDVWLAHVHGSDGLAVHRWDGERWRPAPLPAESGRLSLHGVAAGWTWGVRTTRHSFETHPAFHRWTGTAWQDVPLPDSLARTPASHVGLATAGDTTWAYLKTAAGVHVLRHTGP